MRLTLPALLLASACAGDVTEPSDVAPDPPCEPSVEIPYDGVDQDCNGTDLVDVDGDGFNAIQVGGNDCNDLDPSIKPTATDIPYNGLDEDCDGYDVVDVDGDGFAAWHTGGDDCDDLNSSIYPTADEIPYDGVDQDCDELDLEDLDGDGFAAAVVGGDDCDDSRDDAYPGAPELCNGIDDNCDGFGDDLFVDAAEGRVQAAVDDACPNSTVRVLPGRYSGGLTLRGSVSLVGMGAQPSEVVFDATTCPGTTTACTAISASSLGSVDRSSTLKNFTVTGARKTGIILVDSHVDVSRVWVEGNHGEGGIAVGTTRDEPSQAFVSIDHCTFENNSSSLRGGGLYVQTPATASIRNSVFRRNVAGVAGGGAHIYPLISVEDSVFTDNRVITDGGWGGGLSIHLESNLELITGNYFLDNVATVCPDLVYSRSARGSVPSSNTFASGGEGRFGACL